MLVVIDRFSKFIVLIATRIDITAKQMVHLLMKYVFSYTEFPPEMISDRDKLVVAKIWQELTKIYGIQHRMSTANHHTTAGQVERMNHEIITTYDST